MYEIGKVYIWQNQVGELAYINETECTVLGPPLEFLMNDGRLLIGQITDTECTVNGGIFAERGDLRPKNPPPGEQLINEMFYVNVMA